MGHGTNTPIQPVWCLFVLIFVLVVSPCYLPEIGERAGLCGSLASDIYPDAFSAGSDRVCFFTKALTVGCRARSRNGAFVVFSASVSGAG